MRVESTRYQSELDAQALPKRQRAVLIWGALGFIGFHLTERLLDSGFRVSVLCRSRSCYPEPRWARRVNWYEIDGRSQAATLEAAVSSASIIFDLAGSSGAVASNNDPISSLETNCKVQLEFLEACRKAKHKPRVVFSSSRLVYGDASRERIDETHATNPRSIYAVHKLCIEQYMRVYSSLGAISHTICRISNAYGPDPGRAGQGYKILNSFILKSLVGMPITLFGTGDQVRDFIYIHDLTEVLIRCALTPKAENTTFNVGSGEGRTMVEAANLIRALTGGPEIVFQPWPEEYLSVESGDYISDVRKTEELLAFTPRYSLQEGIADTVRAYQFERESGPNDVSAIKRSIDQIAVAS